MYKRNPRKPRSNTHERKLVQVGKANRVAVGNKFFFPKALTMFAQGAIIIYCISMYIFKKGKVFYHAMDIS